MGRKAEEFTSFKALKVGVFGLSSSSSLSRVLQHPAYSTCFAYTKPAIHVRFLLKEQSLAGFFEIFAIALTIPSTRLCRLEWRQARKQANEGFRSDKPSA